jgi:hypothetical protein
LDFIQEITLAKPLISIETFLKTRNLELKRIDRKRKLQKYRLYLSLLICIDFSYFEALEQNVYFVTIKHFLVLDSHK